MYIYLSEEDLRMRQSRRSLITTLRHQNSAYLRKLLLEESYEVYKASVDIDV
jgi:GDP-D-mannose dehydratase